MTAVFDTSVLLALINTHEEQHGWSMKQLRICQADGPVVVCDAAYCEMSVAMRTKHEVDQTISHFNLERIPNDDDTLFLAGKAFFEYREHYRGKEKPKPTKVLPDFMIGAVAAVNQATLVTANPRDFRRFFPKLHIVEPETNKLL